jgi:hypothetical protein
VPRFRLRHHNTYFELPQGEFVVGRALGSHLMLDDPRVSRRHTRFFVEAQRVTVEDLRSRNGTLVNGVLLKAPQVLADQDVVTVGSQELRMVVVRDVSDHLVSSAHAPTVPDLSDASPPEDLTQVDGPSWHLTLFDKALHVHKYDEAEGHLKRLFASLSSGTAALRSRAPMLLEHVARSVLAYAAATGRSAAIDQVFTLYQRSGLVMYAPLLDEVHTLAQRLRHPLSPQLRAYVEWLRSEAERLGPPERFALQRAEALMRTVHGHTA